MTITSCLAFEILPPEYGLCCASSIFYVIWFVDYLATMLSVDIWIICRIYPFLVKTLENVRDNYELSLLVKKQPWLKKSYTFWRMCWHLKITKVFQCDKK